MYKSVTTSACLCLCSFAGIFSLIERGSVSMIIFFVDVYEYLYFVCTCCQPSAHTHVSFLSGCPLVYIFVLCYFLCLAVCMLQNVSSVLRSPMCQSRIWLALHPPLPSKSLPKIHTKNLFTLSKFSLFFECRNWSLCTRPEWTGNRKGSEFCRTLLKT